MTQQEIERAVAMGESNQELLSLAKAWCTHARADRGPLGVGMVEQMTGLPISGGTLTCDYAQHPPRMAAMDLTPSAFALYRDNCRGCQFRSPGNRVPNLSTWAERVLAEQAEQEAANEAHDAAVAEERLRRVQHRNLVTAHLDAAGHEVVALVNRLDADGQDKNAAKALLETARLTPEVFTAEVQQLLAADAVQLRSAQILDALVALSESGTLSSGVDLHPLAVDAMRTGWGRPAAASYLAANGTVADVDESFVEGVVMWAARSGWAWSEQPGHPEALRHYHALDSVAVEATIARLLRHGETWRRAAAADALRALVEDDPTTGFRLLSPLLDALKFAEDRFDDDGSAGTVAEVIAQLLLHDPTGVDNEVGRRWREATPGYRSRLLHGYDSLLRHGHAETPSVTASVLIARCMAVIGEEPVRTDDIEDDYQRGAAEVLRMAVSRAETMPVDPAVLLGLLLIWLGRLSEVESEQSTDPETALWLLGEGARRERIVQELRHAVKAGGARSAAKFLTACVEAWDTAGDSPQLRRELVGLAASVAGPSYEHLPVVLPMVYTAMLGQDQAVRAAGVEAARSVLRHLDPASVPPMLADAAVASLGDEYVVVIHEAVQTVGELPRQLLNRTDVAVRLLVVAGTFMADRLRYRIAEHALRAAIRLYPEDSPQSDAVRRLALQAIARAQPHECRELLGRFRSLTATEGWADVAIAAMRPDDDPNYEQFGRDDKEWILRQIARHPLTDAQAECLTAVGEQIARRDPRSAWSVCDVLSEAGRPDLGTRVARLALAGVPDTLEKRELRRSAEIRVMRLELERGIRAADASEMDRIAQALADCGDPE